VPGAGGRVVVVGSHRGERAGRRARDREAQDHVAVQPFAGPQGHRDRAVAVAVALVAVGGRGDRVQAGPDQVRREAEARQAGPQRQPDRAGQAGQQHGRGDPARVGHGVGVSHGAGADRRPGERLTRDVPRRDHEREPVFGLAVVDGQRAGQGQRDRGLLAGLEVADPDGEHAGTLLLGDGRALARGDRGVVFLAGFAALAQFALDPAARAVGRERGDPGPVGQREDVRRLDAGGAGVAEGLPHGRRGHQAADRGVDLHGQQRERAGLVAESAGDSGRGSGCVSRRHGVTPGS